MKFLIITFIEKNGLKGRGSDSSKMLVLVIFFLKFYMSSWLMMYGKPDVFRSFKDENGGFIRAKFGGIEGVIELMEASYLALEDEIALGKARVFSTESIEKFCSSAVSIGGNRTTEEESGGHYQVACHALELPLHWRVQWFDARWQIQAYEKGSSRGDMKSGLVELAKLNFNSVQAAHQKDLKELSG